MPQDFEMPEFEGKDGERWIWDPSSHTYVKAEGGGVVPDRNHASGGDNDLFNPAQQDGNLFKPKNPMMEGFMAHTAAGDFNGYSNWETEEAALELSNDAEPYEYIMRAVQSAMAHMGQNPGGEQQAMGVLATYIKQIWYEMEGPARWQENGTAEDPANINWAEIASHFAGMAQEEQGYQNSLDQPGQTGIPPYVQNPVYPPSQYMPGEENSMVAFGSAMPGHDAECQCPDCEKFREQMELNPVQVHDTSPFPDRAPKPNRFKQDNSFPSSISRSNDRGTHMSDFSHLPTWDENIRREAADLDTCPDCGDVMMKGKDSVSCAGCGTKQPVLYTEAQQKEAAGAAIELLPELAGGAAAGGEAGAAGGGAGGGMMGGMGDSLGSPARAATLMNQAMGIGKKLMGDDGGAPLADETNGPPQSDSAQEQGTIAAVDEMMRWALRDYHGGAFGTEEVGGANKNDGHKVNPAEPDTQGFAQQFGDTPDLLKDVNAQGGAKSPVAMQVFEMLLPQAIQPHIDAGGTGASDPVMQWLDQLLEMEYPGYRDGGGAMSVEVKDPNAPDENTGEAADGPDDKENKDEPENSPKKQAVVSYGMPGEAMPGGMGMAMGNPMMSEAPGPCQVCGLDDCVHKRGQQGNAQPNPHLTEQPNMLDAQNYMGQGHMGSFEGKDDIGSCPTCGEPLVGDRKCPNCAAEGKSAAIHNAGPRRPKMCPFHADLVEYALELGDPHQALTAMSQHQFSDASCKGGHKGGCNFKPAMVRQQFWDNHAESLRERREQQLMTPQVTQDIPDLEPIHEDTDYEPVEQREQAKPDITTPWDDGGHHTDMGSDTAVGMPLAAHIHYANAGDLQSLADYLTKQGWSVEFAPDGSLIVHGATEDGQGDVSVTYQPGADDGGQHFTHKIGLFGVTDELGQFMQPQQHDEMMPGQPGQPQDPNMPMQPGQVPGQPMMPQDQQMQQIMPQMGQIPGQQQQPPHPMFGAVEEGDEEDHKCGRCGHGMSSGETHCNFCDADAERNRYESKWKVSEIGIHQPEVKHHDPLMLDQQKHDQHDPMMQGNWTDVQGEPLHEGGDYELQSPNYAIPDHITVKSITPDVLHIVIHGEMGMDYGDQITQQDMANEQYQFQSVEELNTDPGLMQPDTDSAPMDQDNAAQVDDLAQTTSAFSLESMSPAAREHYLAIAAMEGEPVMGASDPSRDWLIQGSVPYTDGVDPETLAQVTKLAGKDYTPREQREFIDEDGTARNIDRLDLEGTHYGPMDESIDSHFLF